ncbi:MAG: glycosyltransferase [Candidatus Omnitrophica bacterium]|nr:glycosyltransferase [Candidatus Omnitrophota bacterium]MCM8806932.1 glycosyltransferase [Candidatus Omnitrophota bacterium]
MELITKTRFFKPTEYSIYKPKICFLSTYIPKPCGIATFTNDLLKHIDSYNILIPSRVIAMNGFSENYDYPDEVVKIITIERIEDYKEAAEFVNNSDIEIVSIQHEFGIFGGEYGEYLLEFLENIKKPSVTTLHTVLPNPPQKMREIVRRIGEKSMCLVVMTNIAENLLKEFYGISKRKVELIYHGVPFAYLRPTDYFKEKLNLKGKIVLSTFGLISRGKGLEYVIYALPEILKEFPNVVYLIIGATHPNIIRQEGESYREFLIKECEKLNLTENVKFINKFLPIEELLDYLGATDIYITPYLNPGQITSGTLSYAIGCGKACISTPYLYAKDMFENGKRGILVNFRDPDGISESVIYLLKNPERKKQLEREAYKLGQKMTWERVAWEYLTLFSRVSSSRGESASVYFEDRLLPIKLTHLETLTDDVGIIQHAKFSMADRKTGYTTDDNARALVVVTKHYNMCIDQKSLNLINTYLSFIYYMQKSNGRFHNLLGYDRNFLDTDGGDDCFGRCIWAIGYLLSSDFVYENIKGAAKHIFDLALPQVEKINSLRGMANCIAGLYYYLKVENNDDVKNIVKKLADRMVENYLSSSDENWQWFENIITYENAKLPLGLLYAYEIIEDENYFKIGMEALNFLIKLTIIENRFIPIGNNGWYVKGGKRAYYDQQPIEATCMIEALKKAKKLTMEEKYENLSLIVFDWFLGRNTKGEMMYDPVTGGCYDGLTKNGPNRNQGAESTIAYLLARLEIEEI